MNPETFLDGKVQLYRGDCLSVLPTLADNSIDAVCTDPPYGLFFMGREWDEADNIAFNPKLWAEVWRVMKPGAHLLSFGGTRTYDLMVSAIRQADFEIRDCIFFCYGSGFPKSRSLRDIGMPELGTALKPAVEPICMARKPLSESSIAANVLRWGTGAINIDGCRVEAGDNPAKWESPRGGIWSTDSTAKAKLTEDTRGRWPANLIHDGSEEVVGGFPEANSTRSNGNPNNPKNGGDGRSCFSASSGIETVDYRDSGSAARFFYTAKADGDDRLGSKHPTVKPLDLMQYLVRLVTPRNGLVLDPFAGTGTCGEAAWREGFSSALIEREPEYQADIVRRMGLVLAGPDQRRAASVKQDDSPLPLFGSVA